VGLSDATLVVGMSVTSPIVENIVGLSDAEMVVGMAVALPIVGLIEGLAGVGADLSTHFSASVSHWQLSSFLHRFLFDCSEHWELAAGLIVGLRGSAMVVGMADALPSVGLIEGLAEVGERLSTHSSASVSHWQWSTLLHRFLFDCSEH